MFLSVNNVLLIYIILNLYKFYINYEIIIYYRIININFNYNNNIIIIKIQI
jgi:hypothetical protein